MPYSSRVTWSSLATRVMGASGKMTVLYVHLPLKLENAIVMIQGIVLSLSASL